MGIHWGGPVWGGDKDKGGVSGMWTKVVNLCIGIEECSRAQHREDDRG